MCAVFGHSRQSYYERQTREARAIQIESFILQDVRAIRCYLPKSGWRQLHAELQELCTAHGIGRDAFIRILRNNDLMQVNKRSGVRTTYSQHKLFVYQNLVANLLITNVLQVWVADITYIHTQEGFVYLALVTDSFSRKIVGWDSSDSLELEGSLRACKMAIGGIPKTLKGLASKLIHHSDRGSQYCSHAYVRCLQANGIAISMADTGNCYQNAQAESINGRLKVEFLLDTIFPTKKAAYTAIENAILTYNTRRPHGSIAYQKPAAFHQEALNTLVAKMETDRKQAQEQHTGTGFFRNQLLRVLAS